ncbi:MAG: 50S ribosomal protein L10 [Clostridia bacterium]|jgi:large subunit ribosomal protein L10|nr:50S ribosomal protein L10 [Clostridia bacterium]
MENKPQLVVKENQVAELQSWIAESSGVVLTDYRGLTVSEVTELRANLRKNEVGYKVAKNTLIKRAANNLEITDLDSHFAGPTAIAFAKDPIAVAKTLVEFAEKHKALEIKAGLLDGKFVGIDVIKNLAKLPSREVLLAKMLGSMQSSLYSFVRVIDQIREKQEAVTAAE